MQIEVFVLVDEEGNHVASHEEANLGDLYDEQIGAESHQGRRVVKLVIDVPLPTPIMLAGTVTEPEAVGTLVAAK